MFDLTVQGDRCMSIFSRQGMKVVYKNRNGYPIQRDIANKFLVEGKTYTVDHVIRGRSASIVVLAEFPTQQFNTVMFDNV
jgi:hypothetical protein